MSGIDIYRPSQIKKKTFLSSFTPLFEQVSFHWNIQYSWQKGNISILFKIVVIGFGNFKENAYKQKLTEYLNFP